MLSKSIRKDGVYKFPDGAQMRNSLLLKMANMLDLILENC